VRGWPRVSCAGAFALALLGPIAAGAAAPTPSFPMDDETPRTLPSRVLEPGSERAGTDREDVAPERTLGRGRPIAESVDRAVDELILKHFSSCGRSEGEDVPCFPVSVERKWQYSVAGSLEHLEFDSRPTPGRPPTVAEMSGARPGPLSASGSVSFDPVCKGRQLLKAITGRSRTYYLYRVWDENGEHAVLRDQPMAAAEWSGRPAFQYVELGSFGDECEAIAAWRKALRETRARRAQGGVGETPAASGDDAHAREEALEAGDPPP